MEDYTIENLNYINTSFRIPANALEILLPQPSLTVLELLDHKLPLISSVSRNIAPSQFFSKDDANITEPMVLQRLAIPPGRMLKELAEACKVSAMEGANSVMCAHLSNGPDKRVPLWTIPYWMEVAALRIGPRAAWGEADACLQVRQQSRKGKGTAKTHSLVDEVYGCLAGLQWHGTTRGFSNCDPISSLAKFATREWLSDANEDQMLDLLRTDLRRDTTQRRALVKGTQFIAKLHEAYEKRDTTYKEARHFESVREAGIGLGDGTYEQLGTVMHRESHWLAVVVDAKSDRILYGDSFDGQMNESLKKVLSWWTHHHTGRVFTFELLTITRQLDGFSCGLLSWNALAHYFYPLKYPLINANAVDDGRLEVLLRIADHHQDRVRSDHKKHNEYSHLANRVSMWSRRTISSRSLVLQSICS